MKKAEYLAEIMPQYDLVRVLSQKNGAEVLHLRHKTLSRDLVLRNYEKPIAVYSEIKDYKAENLPIVYDSIDLDDGQIVFEEFIDGINLSQMLETEKISYKTAKKIILPVCRALRVLHSKNIIHRDVKPENVIITNDGRVVLVDFNASRIYTLDKNTDTVVLGTVGYASPEQFGISQSDEKSDIYAVGVLLNVMLTGKHPSETLAKGRAGKIVLKCTQIDPQSRFKAVEKLIDVL